MKFVRHLPAFGYRPVVVTGPGEPSGRWTPVDNTLEGEIPPETEVVRVPGPPPGPSRGRRARAERWLGLPKPFSRWWVEQSVEKGRALDVELVYASMSPYESAEAAARIAGELGTPWVADLRDPWALDEMLVYPTRIHRLRELRRMRRLLVGADAIIMNTPEAVRRLAAFPEFSKSTIAAVPNGFDAEDFAGPPPTREDDAFRIVHTGYLHTELGRSERGAGRLRRLLGGSVPGVDILARSHVFLLEAIERLRAEEPELGERIELHLAGLASAGDREAAERSRNVRFLGYVPHKETVALMRSSSCRCTACRPEDGPASCRGRPTSILRPGRRSSRLFLTEMLATSSSAPATRISAGRPTSLASDGRSARSSGASAAESHLEKRIPAFSWGTSAVRSRSGWRRSSSRFCRSGRASWAYADS
jgi:glycosyltransferase involved in cell wall biosynthesis